MPLPLIFERKPWIVFFNPSIRLIATSPEPEIAYVFELV